MFLAPQNLLASRTVGRWSMRVRLVAHGLCVALCAVPAAPSFAGLYQAGPARPIARSGPLAGRVVGTAWRPDNSPLARALLRVRDLTSGRIVLGVQADDQGRFNFSTVPAGSYVVELVNERGAVRAVGQRFSVRGGETVATSVRLGPDGRWLDGVLGSAAAAALAAAASLGVTAIGDGVQPASPRF
jgi:hypothetical protein